MTILKLLRALLAVARLTASDTRSGSGSNELRRARDYNRQKERLVLIGLLLSTLSGTLFIFSGGGAKLRTRVERRAGHGLGGQCATTAIYGLLGWLAGLPLGYYSGFVIEHRFGLSNQTRRAWLGEQIKGLGLMLAFEIPLTTGAYAVIRRWPRAWWAILSGLSVPLTVLLAQLFPVLIAPIFNKYEPLRDRALAERLKQLAAESGIQVADVLQMDMSRQTEKANAFFAGLGPTKRIVLADTLLEKFTPEEIEAVVAHETGHQAHHDIWRFVALGTAFTFILTYTVSRAANWSLVRFGRKIGTSDLGDVATLPLLGWILSLAGLVLTPLQSAYSRRIERNADTFALRLTHDPLGFGSAMTRLAEVNLSDPKPPAVVRYLLYSHPPVAERIERARAFARENALPEPSPLRVE